jgi:hypothetical protein
VTVYPRSMESDDATVVLERFAVEYAGSDVHVLKANAVRDERLDGEPVTRVTLLLDDPVGDTWDAPEIRRLRRSLGRKATDLQLPAVSVTLVPASESELVESFDE